MKYIVIKINLWSFQTDNPIYTDVNDDAWYMD